MAVRQVIICNIFFSRPSGWTLIGVKTPVVNGLICDSNLGMNIRCFYNLLTYPSDIVTENKRRGDAVFLILQKWILFWAAVAGDAAVYTEPGWLG